MSRSHIASTLMLALAWGTMACGQGSNVNASPLEARVGKTITVSDASHPAEKAVVTQVWRLADGWPGQPRSPTAALVLAALWVAGMGLCVWSLRREVRRHPASQST